MIEVRSLLDDYMSNRCIPHGYIEHDHLINAEPPSTPTRPTLVLFFGENPQAVADSAHPEPPHTKNTLILYWIDTGCYNCLCTLG